MPAALLARLGATLPSADRAASLWAYGAMTGAMRYMLAGGGRMKELSDGKVDPDDIRTCIEQLVAIALAGFRR